MPGAVEIAERFLMERIGHPMGECMECDSTRVVLAELVRLRAEVKSLSAQEQSTAESWRRTAAQILARMRHDENCEADFGPEGQENPCRCAERAHEEGTEQDSEPPAGQAQKEETPR